MRACTLLFFIFSCFQYAQCYKVLLIANMPSPSHYFLINTLAKELVNVGHNITIISPFSEKNPPNKKGTYREIVIVEAMKVAEGLKGLLLEMDRMNPFQNELLMSEFGVTFTEITLEEPKVQELLSSNEHFDVIVEVQCLNDALKAFSHRFNAPIIMFGTMFANNWINPLVGNPTPPSFVPDMLLSYTEKMNIWQRTVNFIFRMFQNYYRNFYFLPKQNEIMKKYFPSAPDLNLLYYNSSLVFINSHESINQAIPQMPNMVQIGGFHVEPPKKLPQNLQKYLDDANEGAVYFSMGSNIKPSQMKNETIRALVGAFKKLKLKVLWKWDENELWNKPENVMIAKWFPQNDILAHPNTKLFITHGGLLSTIETVYHGVPILAFPIFADQKLNVQKAKDSGIGLIINYDEITEEKLTEALNELLQNPKYVQNAKHRSVLLRDRPVKPLDLAVYWVEYISRHKGAEHLKNAGLMLSWYQYFSLDSIILLIFTTLLTCYFVYSFIILTVCDKFNQEKKIKIN